MSCTAVRIGVKPFYVVTYDVRISRKCCNVRAVVIIAVQYIVRFSPRKELLYGFSFLESLDMFYIGY